MYFAVLVVVATFVRVVFVLAGVAFVAELALSFVLEQMCFKPRRRMAYRRTLFVPLSRTLLLLLEALDHAEKMVNNF